jgi:argininosuccinate lyase
MALWGGRFEKGVDAFTQEFGASLEDDKAMAQQDITASRRPREDARQARASSRMRTRRQDRCRPRRRLQGEIKAGTFEWDVNDEDIHMAVESKLIEDGGSSRARVSTPGARGTTRWLTDIRLLAKDLSRELAQGEPASFSGVLLERGRRTIEWHRASGLHASSSTPSPSSSLTTFWPTTGCLAATM